MRQQLLNSHYTDKGKESQKKILINLSQVSLLINGKQGFSQSDPRVCALNHYTNPLKLSL